MKSLYVTLLLASITLMQLFFGGGDGTRLIYTLPGHIVLGLSGVLALFSIRKAPARVDRACLLTAVVLAIYLFARIAFSPSSWLAQFDFYGLIGALLIYFVTALLIRGGGARLAIVCGLLVLAVVQVVIGLIQFAKDSNFNPLLTEARTEAGVRASGLFISPNHLAGFLEVALLLATSVAFWGNLRARGKMLFGYLALICLAGIVLTGSRGGYLSAGSGLAVFALVSVWAMRPRLARGVMPRIIAVVVVIVMVGGALALVAERNPAIRARVNTVFVTEDVRLQLWKAAWQQFKLAPVFGTGSRTYTYYGRTFRAKEVQSDPVFAHSDWLQGLAEYGLVGVLLVAGLFAAHLRHGWRRSMEMARQLSTTMPDTSGKHALALQIGTISALAAALVHALVDFNLHIPANLLLIACLFGLLATRETDTRFEKADWPARLLYALPAALGLWMLIVGAPRVPGELFAETARGKLTEFFKEAARGKMASAKIMSEKLRAGQEDAAQAIGRGVRNPDLYFQLGEVQRFNSQILPTDEARRFAIEDALGEYAEALAIFPQDVGIVLRNAWALDRLERFDEAGPLIARAKELDPNSPMPWVYGALHWKMRNMPAEALADYHKAGSFNYGWVPKLAGEIGETFDPAAMESLLKQSPPTEPK